MGLHIKSCRLKLAAMLAAAFVGGTPILMCPAAHNRMHKSDWYALDAAGKLSANITTIMRRFFSGNRCYVLLVMALFLIMLTMLIFETKDISARIIHVLAAVLAIYVTFFYCVMNQMGFYECDAWLYLAYLIVMSVELLGFLLGRGELILAFSYLAASASIGCLILVPSNDIQFRCILPYIFLSMPTFAYIIQQASDLAAIGRLKTARKLWYGCVAGLMAVFWLLGLHNMQNIYAGYSMNETVNEYNDGCMYKAAEEYWSDGTLPDIVLYQLPDTVCRGRMQYEQGFEGISKWMAEYYDLPREIKITWRNDTMSCFVLA